MKKRIQELLKKHPKHLAAMIVDLENKLNLIKDDAKDGRVKKSTITKIDNNE